jgi:poly(ADP-ribose) glycohydrolase ARH3
MRVTPAALFAYPDLQAAARLGRSTAELTHAHALGVDGAAFQAATVSFALAAAEDTTIGARAMCAAVAAVLTSDLYMERLERVLALLVNDPPPPTVAAELGNGSSAPESVPTALYCFLRHPGSFVDAISFAVLLGGDTDSIAAMTGALSGAYLGEEALPTSWVDRIEDAARMRHLADSLCERALSDVGAGWDR